MDELSRGILRELLPQEKEVFPPPAKADRAANPMDHWSLAVLRERGEYLGKLAKHGDGSAGETLKEFPGHAAMLSFRSRDGQAEVHEEFADLFYVLEGRATLLTGGTVVGAKTVAPGEMRGDAIEGGTRQELRPGDLAHVPAGLPHQMLVASDRTVTCFVLKIAKVEEKP
jgi:mannose-6-phosphate isomerase-like protein (cupin superfamily)